jgi:suppressor for copper-sensitivity B
LKHSASIRTGQPSALWSRIAATLILLATVWPVASAWAAAGPWASEQAVRARLVAATDAVGQDRELHAGLQVSLDEGWETYWRSPGDAGAPPRADWSGSRNVGAVDWRWPAPTRFTLFGLETYGYRGEVVFPLTIHLERPGEPVSLSGKLELLVCSKICVPKTVALTLDLPAGAATADPEASNLIARSEAQVPDDCARSGLRVDNVAVEPGSPGVLKIGLSSSEPLGTPDVIIENPKWSFGTPEFSFGADRRTATATLPVISGPDAVGISGADLTVTAKDGLRASESRHTVGRTNASTRNWLGELLPFLGLALVGGLILNLMPCVLPVLSLKLLAVLRHQGQERRQIRRAFVATAAGVIVSMIAIGAILAGLKVSGAAVGWGIQFQQPLFLAFLAGVLIVFAANLAGLFEFALPPRMATALAGTGGERLAGGFLAGAFTTILATPCSAPFVGTAIAFALARGPLEILAIFGALGIGLAAPHLLVAAFPALTRALPKPGRWMRLVRGVLAVALAGTAVWLLTVLSAQTSWQAAASIAAAFIVLAAALAARPRIGAPAAAVLVALAVLGAAAAPAVFGTMPTRAATTAWLPFDDATIRRLVAEGQVVFVDVTADWCVTCHANKALVIDAPEVARALAQPHTAAMLADWTRPNPRISDYLARNNRYGIPFNAIYGPGAPRGIVLSELLTKQAVLDALRQARGNGQLSSR